MINKFIKFQLIGWFFVSLQISFLIPIISKLQGLHWALTLITIYNIFLHLTSMGAYFLKSVNVKKLFLGLIVLDIIYFLAMGLYFININLFLYIESIIALIYSLVSPTFNINYDTWLAKNYEEQFNLIKHYGNLIYNTAGLFSLSMALILSILFNDISQQIIAFGCIMMISIIYSVFNYIKFWKDKEFI